MNAYIHLSIALGAFSLFSIASPAFASSSMMQYIAFGTTSIYGKSGAFVKTTIPDSSYGYAADSTGNKYRMIVYYPETLSYWKLYEVGIQHTIISGKLYRIYYDDYIDLYGQPQYHQQTAGAVGTNIGFECTRFNGREFDAGIDSGSIGSSFKFGGQRFLQNEYIGRIIVEVASGNASYTRTASTYRHLFLSAAFQNSGSWQSWPTGSSGIVPTNDSTYGVSGDYSGSLENSGSMYMATYH